MVDVICPPLSISSIVVSLWLAGCLAKSTLIGWREYYGGGGVGVDRHLCGAQQKLGFDPMLFHYWPTAIGAGPTLEQHQVKASCLLGELSALWYTRAVCVWLEQAVHSALCRDFTLVTSVFTSEKLVSVAWDLCMYRPTCHCAAYHLFNTVQCRYKNRSFRISPITLLKQNCHRL